jgi:hypothetical protein
MRVSREKMILKKVGTSLVIVIGAYALVEAGYRLYQYNHLLSKYRAFWFWSVESPLYVVDSQTGYRYKSDSLLTSRYFNEKDDLIRSNPIRVNYSGHISSRNDPGDKPGDEYRVAILGDSFTACTTNTLPWSDLLESNLNQDQDLKRSLGVQSFRVINCGMDGTGIVQWPRVYDADASRFKPDLVVVNFITGDISRQFIYRDSIMVASKTADYQVTITCSSLPPTLQNRDCTFARVIVANPTLFNDKSRTSEIKKEIYDTTVRSLPWFSPYPEILALSRMNGMKPRLHLENQRLNPYFQTAEEAVSASSKALREIADKKPSLLIFHHPTLDELLHPTRELPQIVESLMTQSRPLKIETMLRYLPAADRTEISSWYIANDGHPSDYGCQLYARAMVARLKDHFLKGSTVR